MRLGAAHTGMDRPAPPRSRRLHAIALAIAIASRGISPATAYEPGDLGKVETLVRSGYADVAQLPPQMLADLMARDDALLIFDVRDEEEFRVSHLPGAIRVDPGSWSQTFVNRYGQSVQGKRVVFYCSVGIRSSRLAGRVQEALFERGAAGVYNLSGGLFRWHNEGRHLVDERGPTPLIHPYDSHWGGLIERQDLTATAPRAAQAEQMR